MMSACTTEWRQAHGVEIRYCIEHGRDYSTCVHIVTAEYGTVPKHLGAHRILGDNQAQCPYGGILDPHFPQVETPCPLHQPQSYPTHAKHRATREWDSPVFDIGAIARAEIQYDLERRHNELLSGVRRSLSTTNQQGEDHV